MTENVLYTAAIGLITTLLSTLITYFLTKRKYDSTVDVIDLKNLVQSIDVYKTMVEDYKQQTLIATKESTDNAKEILRVKKVMRSMLVDLCMKKSCLERQFPTVNQIDDLLGIPKEDDNNTQKSEDNETNS